MSFDIGRLSYKVSRVESGEATNSQFDTIRDAFDAFILEQPQDSRGVSSSTYSENLTPIQLEMIRTVLVSMQNDIGADQIEVGLHYAGQCISRYNMLCRSISINCGRGSGHSTVIGKLAKCDDLIITSEPSNAALKQFRDCRATVLHYSTLLQSKYSELDRFRGKTFHNVWIDNASLIAPHQDKMLDLYSAIGGHFSHLNHELNRIKFFRFG